MKKIYTLLFAFLLTFGILAGCGAADEKEANQTNTEKTEQTEKAGFPITVTDAAKEKVTIEAEPERIVSLVPSNTETAFALGLGDKVVGVSDNDNYPEEVSKIDKVGGMEFNIEKIIALKPDLVLAHEMAMSTSAEGLQQLRDAGIPVLVMKSEASFEDVYSSIETIGTVTGTKKEAETIIKDMKSKVEEIKDKAAAIKEDQKKKVYVELDVVPNIFGAGKSTFMDEMLTMINAENVVTGEGWQSIDPEAVIKSNPDVIITTYGVYTENAVDNLLNRAGWQDVNAVKNKQVIDVNPDKVSRPGPRLVEGVEDFAKAVYPEVFTK